MLIRMFQLVLVLFLIMTQSHTVFAAKKSQAPLPEENKEMYPTINEMLGSMLMFGFRGMNLEPASGIAKLFSDGIPCNVILFDRDVTDNTERNIKSPTQVTDLTKSMRELAKKEVLIAVDQEGGQVRRLRPQKGFLDLPSAQSMGQRNVTETLEMAEALGKEMLKCGINVDLAPVVDVDVNPFNPAIGKLGRAFSSDPALVSAHALAFGQGLARNGVIPVLKHFPGQGCATGDTHFGVTDVSQCWNANTDLLPYAEIFNAGWPGMVMVGHIRLAELDAELPASLSRNIVTGLLREGLGWQGVIISDDLQMGAVTNGRNLKDIISLALNAGNDILLFGNNLEWKPNLAQEVWNALQELLTEGTLTEERIRDSWRRIDALQNAYKPKWQSLNEDVKETP